MTKAVTLFAGCLLAGCALPAPPPAPVPPEILPTAAVARPTGALLDPFVGRFTSGRDTLVIRRAGDMLVAEQGGAAIPLTFVGTGTFADAAGTTYLFASAPSRLTVIGADGTRRDWVR